MPDDLGYLDVSALLGLVGVTRYAWVCRRHKRSLEVGHAVNILLHSVTLVVGALLVASTFFPSLQRSLTEARLPALLTGVAITILAGQALVDLMQLRPGSTAARPPEQRE